MFTSKITTRTTTYASSGSMGERRKGEGGWGGDKHGLLSGRRQPSDSVLLLVLHSGAQAWSGETGPGLRVEGGVVVEGAEALRVGRLSDAPLAAGALDDVGGGVALVAGVKVPLALAAGRLEVARGAAHKALPEVLEQVPRKAHVDPWVAAAVEAGQQHGDDEGHGWRRRRRRRRRDARM